LTLLLSPVVSVLFLPFRQQVSSGAPFPRHDSAVVIISRRRTAFIVASEPRRGTGIILQSFIKHDLIKIDAASIVLPHF
jgi:hypothetical protein